MKRGNLGRNCTVGNRKLHCGLSSLTLCSFEPYTVPYFKKTVGVEGSVISGYSALQGRPRPTSQLPCSQVNVKNHKKS